MTEFATLKITRDIEPIASSDSMHESETELLSIPVTQTLNLALTYLVRLPHLSTSTEANVRRSTCFVDPQHMLLRLDRDLLRFVVVGN